MLQLLFFLILNHKYCHEIKSDRFPRPPANELNGVIHGGFSMDVIGPLAILFSPVMA